VPAPSEPITAVRLEADLVVGTPEALTHLALRSHLSDGLCVAWAGRLPVLAVDAERDRLVPAALAARFGTDDFWGRWTRLECVAKVTETPVALLLGTTLTPPQLADVRLFTLRLRGGIVASVAIRVTG
jgi:hypothetical protein